MKSKPFPIKEGIPCQLKWNHSTVFLTMATTASCHRVTHDPYEFKDNKMNFHNIKTKLEARTKMLKGEWPGRGCEHCKSTEDAGGHSDRMSHLNMQGVTAPKELEKDTTAVDVTPTQLEIYFSNQGEPVRVYGKIEINPNIKEDTDKLFAWLEEHIHELNKVMILGGEPFLQKETERMVELLERKSNPHLTLVVFSNLTVDPARVQKWLARMWKLVEQGKLDNLQVVGSLDCWGPQAEYVRNGLDLKKYTENFEFMMNKTRITTSINSALMALTIPTLPDLIVQLNKWSKIREVYWSGMKAGDHMRPYLNPTIFGKAIVPLGMSKAIDIFETNGDPIKEAQLNNLIGIKTECENTEPNTWDQKMLKGYIEELDRRRGLDYKKLFPEIATLLEA